MRNCPALLSGIIAFLPVATAAAVERFDPAARARIIAPFMDEQTVLVAHVDLAAKPDGRPRADIDAVHALIKEVIQTVMPDKEASQSALSGIQQAKEAADAWLAGFARAGGTEIYAGLSVADLPAHAEPFTVVPLARGADARAIAGLLCNGDASGATTRPAGGSSTDIWTAETVGNAVFCGARSTLERLRSGKPADRPELIRAFAAAGDSAAQVLLLPTADARRVLEDMFPTLPPFLGGGPVKAVTRGVMWAAVAIDTRPQVAVRWVIQSENAEAAQGLSRVIDAAFDAARADRRLSAYASPIDELSKLLRPTIVEDRLELALDGKTGATAVARALVPVLSDARNRAWRAASANNIKQIMMGCIMYANDHKGQWPPNLESIVEGNYVPAEVLVGPMREGEKVGYVYVRPASPLNKIDPRAAVVYERHETWGEGVNVGYADGHVEYVKDEARFRKAMSLAQTQPAAKP